MKAFRDQEYHAAVDTNNGAEALHKTLKYSYLPKQRSMTLSSIAKLLVEDFLPKSRKIYLFKNYKQSSLYRSYKELVPPYLKERPRSVILHCLHRQASSLKFPEENIHDVDVEKGEFRVIKSDKKERIVNFGQSSNVPNCSRLDCEKFHLPCKHFFAIFRLRAKWSWYMLPKSYLESSYLSLDNKALESYYQESSPPCDLPDPPYTNNDSTAQCEDEIPSKKVHL